MNWDAIGAIGEILGAIAVLLTLFYLARQIQQSNKIALIAASNESFSNYASLNELYINNPRILELLAEIRHLEDPSEIGDIERGILSAFLRRLFNAWYPTSVSYENGLIPVETFNSIAEDAKFVAEELGPAGRIIWRELLLGYESFAENSVIGFIHSALDKFDTPR